MSREMKELTPQQYFDAVKDAKKKVTDEELARVYDNCLELINKYKITGQNSAIKKCIFHLDSVEREREIVKMGINTFVYRDDIEYYINDVASDVVKIIELERYEREIPDEIVNIIADARINLTSFILSLPITQEKLNAKCKSNAGKKTPSYLVFS